MRRPWEAIRVAMQEELTDLSWTELFFGTAVVRPFASIDEWIMRRPWETIRTAMQEELADPTWTELFFGTAFIAAGSRNPGEPSPVRLEDR